MGQTKDVAKNDAEVMNEVLNENGVLVDDFYEEEKLEEVAPENNMEEIKMDDINLEETFGIEEEDEEVEEDAPISPVVMPAEENRKRFFSESVNIPSPQLTRDNADFDALFDSLYNDVAGANNFISTLIEQKKNVTDNADKLKEEKDKLAKEKEEFERFVNSQRESIELEKAQCNEYIRTQKLRLQNEEAQFNADAEATRAELALADASIKAASEKLESEKAQFRVYKELEEKKQKTEVEKIEKDRNKLEADIQQFQKEQEVVLNRLNTESLELKKEREQFEKSKEIDLEKIKNAQLEIMSQREQFERFKELEERKLELESKNLSQSCARFKELVSQFNSGFQQLPDADK